MHVLLSQDVPQLPTCLQRVLEVIFDILLENLFGHRVIQVQLPSASLLPVFVYLPLMAHCVEPLVEHIV